MSESSFDIDLTPLRVILSEYSPQGRTALLPILHAAQDIYGYLPAGVAAEIGISLGVPLAEVFGVIDFYTHYYSQSVGKTVVHVCTDPACAFAGADSLFKAVSQQTETQGNHLGQAQITVESASCLGWAASSRLCWCPL